MATNIEIAKHLDLSAEYVSRLKGLNVLPSAPGKSMDLDQCRFAYINWLRNKARLTSNTEDGTITEHKTRLTSAQATKAEMEVEILSNELIRAEDIKNAWIEFVSNVKSKLMNLPSKLAHQVVGLDDYADTEELLTKEVHEALEELAKSELPGSIEMGMDGSSESVPTTKTASG